MSVLACAGYAHGDVSAYNILVHQGNWITDLLAELAVEVGLD